MELVSKEITTFMQSYDNGAQSTTTLEDSQMVQRAPAANEELRMES